MYVDIDTLFLRPARELWRLFGCFAGRQVVGMARETEVVGTGYYGVRRFADEFV